VILGLHTCSSSTFTFVNADIDIIAVLLQLYPIRIWQLSTSRSRKVFSLMATIRGILVKQFGGPEVLEYVHGISLPPKPACRQVCICNDTI